MPPPPTRCSWRPSRARRNASAAPRPHRLCVDSGPMFYTHGWVHVIAGCMFCGKTDEMLRLLRRFSIAGRRVILVKPRLDTRTDRVTVVSRSGAQHHAITVDDSTEIEAAVTDADIVAIEEGQFFDERLPEVVERLAELGKQVVVTGLDRDFRGHVPPSVTSPIDSEMPILGWFVMYRSVPESDPDPKSVPCGPRSTSTRERTKRSTSGVKSEREITDSSR